MKLVSIGAGNVASQFIPYLAGEGHQIVQVYSRKSYNAKRLANKVKATSTASLQRIIQDADVYIISVPDNAISEVINQFNFKLQKEQCVFHMSGTTSDQVLRPFSENFGVMWPIQTFSKGQSVNIKTVPFCLSANDKTAAQKQSRLLKKASQKIKVSEEDRLKLHAAAVISCNFSNHLYHLVELFLKDSNIDFKLMLPLINETVRKANMISPGKAQTGPAIRRDSKTIQQHMKLLKDNKDLKKLYTLLTKSIQDTNA